MMLPLIDFKGQKILFTADLFPCTHHIGMPWVMAYDMRPLETMKEKAKVLKKAAEENWLLFFEHDAMTEICTLNETERGIKAGEKIKAAELFNHKV
jgi:glyoxylase-like metal-dependent hydrolase (beta-lactamase superfamily II)